jgi:hypothetical protein
VRWGKISKRENYQDSHYTILLLKYYYFTCKISNNPKIVDIALSPKNNEKLALPDIAAYDNFYIAYYY